MISSGKIVSNRVHNRSDLPLPLLIFLIGIRFLRINIKWNRYAEANSTSGEVFNYILSFEIEWPISGILHSQIYVAASN